MLPQDFIDRLHKLIPADKWQSVLQSFSIKKPTSARINTLKVAPEQGYAELQQLGIDYEVMPWWPNAFVIPSEQHDQLTHSQAFIEGRIYIQNLESMLAPLVLDPQPGEQILDLTSAPGSKTTQMAAMMANQGRIAAVEKSKSRFFRLKNNCALQGAEIVDFYLKDGALVGAKTPNRFDRVLLDAPCSSEGRFSTLDEKSYYYWNIKKIKEMARAQKRLIYSAFRALKPGGVLVYSTCTFAPEENEQIIAKLLKKFATEASLETFALLPQASHGLNGLQQCQRILPNNLFNGFFICRLRKSDKSTTV